VSLTTRALTIISAVGAATAAGAFFTFSTFTIRGLKRLPPSQGAAAMQSINRQAPTPAFMLVLFGTGVACLLLGVDSIRHLDEAFAKQRLIASGIYLVGVIGLTIGYHVPRNNLLDAVDPASADGVAYWATYLTEWVRLNHVRTIAPLITSVLLAFSLTSDVLR
jgi:uncharacterized membrane protein